MRRIVTTAAGMVAIALVAACGRNPQPARTTPATTAANAQRTADSLAAARAAEARQLAERMRADSLRADSITRAEASRAERVRREVQGGGMAPETMTSTGLSEADSTSLSALIHFALDSDRIAPEYERLLEDKLRILQANPRLQIRIGGHADERGSDEYNLALGQRRALAVQRWLIDRGVSADRLAVMSFGEERPLAAGHAEDAWSMNRRADVLVTRPAR